MNPMKTVCDEWAKEQRDRRLPNRYYVGTYENHNFGPYRTKEDALWIKAAIEHGFTTKDLRVYLVETTELPKESIV